MGRPYPRAVYRFAARPRWIASHLFVLVLVVLMVNLGFWQLDRLDQKQDRNALIRERTAAPTAELGTLTTPGAPLTVGAELQYRRATASGQFLAEEEVLVRNRTLDGRPGYWVLSPLALDTGGIVVVNRGWIPVTGGEAADSAPPAPAGEVTVAGVLRRTEEARGLAVADPADGELTFMNRPDLGRLQQQLDDPVVPVVLQIVPPDDAPPGGGELPVPVPLPPLDEGPHLSYAFQWFTFATIATVGYLLFLRKHGRELAREAAATE